MRPSHVRLLAAVGAVLVLASGLGRAGGSEATSRDAPPVEAAQAGSAPRAQVGPYALYLPLVQKASSSPPSGCPTSSSAQFGQIPTLPPAADHPDSLHADLNLSLRGWEPTTAALTLVDYGGEPAADPPQMPGLFTDYRTPTFTSAHQVYDWDWDCGGQPHGCRGPLLTWPEVTLLGMATTPGEAIRIPSRDQENYGGGFKAMVMYAEEQRITLGYFRQDSVAYGYTVHIENVCVDPNLLSLYQALNSAGRHDLPALHNDETLGTAVGSEILVAVRDLGTFLDPRSREDWWQGR